MNRTSREPRAQPALEQLLSDLRHGVRSLIRAPAYSLAAVAVLALGIGANTAVFSVADAVLFRPLPYPQPHRLFVFVERSSEGQESYFDLASFRFLRDHQSLAEVIATVDTTSGINLATDHASFYTQAARVSAGYFDVLGIPPMVGRSFGDHELDQSLVVLGHDAFGKLGGDSAIVGQSVSLGGDPHTVIGIMPAGFEGTPRADLWLPSKPDFQGQGTNFQILGRSRADLELEAGDAAAANLSDEYFRRYDQESEGRRLGVVGLREELSSYRRPDLLRLLGAVSLLLLVACANTASLLLARLAARGRELAIRSALGGGRRRILQLLGIESLTLGLAGGIVSVGLAALSLNLFATVVPEDILGWSVQLDSRVLGVCLLLSLGCGLLFSAGPALLGSRVELAQALHRGGRSSEGAGTVWWRRLLVIAQVAVSLTLLVAAGLLIQSLARLQSVELGFEPDRVWAAEMSLQGAGLENAAAIQHFAAQGIERLESLPGVERVAIGSNIPGKRGLNLPVSVPEREDGPERGSINYAYVSEGYFDSLGVALLRGRGFEPSDRSGGPPVTLVNQAFVRRFFPSGEVLGRTIEPVRFSPEADDVARTIVGVVADFRGRRLDEEQPPSMYVPLEQATSGTMVITHRFFATNWILKTNSGAELGPGRIEAAMREVAPNHPFSRIRTMADLVGAAVASQRFLMVLLLTFSILAVLMAAAGLYGVISFNVARRTKEIGLRMALGAGSRRILGSVLAEGIALAGFGIAIGLVAATMLGRFLDAMIFGISAHDPLTLIAAVLVLLAMAAIATLQPALRAARVDPTTSIRAE